MEQMPGQGEFGVTLAGEQVLEVNLQVTGPGQGSGIAQQAELAAIADQCPEVLATGVEVFLGQLEGGFAAAAAAGHGETGVRFVQAEVVGGDDEGQGPGQGADRVVAVADAEASDLGQLAIAEGVPQQFGDEAVGQGGGVQVGPFHLGREVAPLGGGDLEGPAVFVLKLEAAGDAVVGLRLVLGLAQGGLFQLIGEEQPPFQAQAGKLEGEALVADFTHGHAPSQAVWQENINPDQVQGQAGADAVVADIAGGLAHPTVILEQGLGPRLGQGGEPGLVLAQEVQGGADLPFHLGGGQVAAGRALQQASGGLIGQPLGICPPPDRQAQGLLGHQLVRLPASRIAELVAQAH
jgi:hypothetical protein